MRHFCRRHGLSGLELLPYGGLGGGTIPPELIRGVHLTYHNCWVDYWNGNAAGVEAEYDDMETADRLFGGGRQAIIDRYRAQLEFAKSVGAEYVVFHVSDVSLQEAVSYRFLHSDEEVIKASLELINAVLGKRRYPFCFFVENLWWPGFNMTSPDMTRLLLDGIDYENKGIMLDTGHLLHTNTALKTEEEAVGYVHEVLDAHGDLLAYIKGVHLHQSLSGDYVRKLIQEPPKLEGAYYERLAAVYGHVFSIDTHKPFTGRGLRGLIERIKPAYLTHEFLTDNRGEHERYLSLQNTALTAG